MAAGPHDQKDFTRIKRCHVLIAMYLIEDPMIPPSRPIKATSRKLSILCQVVKFERPVEEIRSKAEQVLLRPLSDMVRSRVDLVRISAPEPTQELSFGTV